MAPRPAVRLFTAAGAIALVTMAILWPLAPVSRMPPVSPMGDQPVYSVADEPRLPVIEPVLRAPWLDGTRLGASVLPVAVVLAGTGAAIVAGATTGAVLFVMVSLVLDPAFAASLVHQASVVIAVGLVWLAAGGAFSGPSHPGPRPWLRVLAAMMLWGLAVWWHWLALAAWPVVVAGLRRQPDRPARGVWTLASVVTGLGAAVAHFAWVADAAGRQAVAPGVSVGWLDALAVAFDTRPRLPAGSFAAPDVASGDTYLLLALVAAGLAFGTVGRWWRRAVVLTASLLLAIALGWPEWQVEALRFGTWLLAPLAALGLTWAAAQVRPGRQAVVVVAIGAILAGESIVARVRPLNGQEARAFRDAFAQALERSVAHGPVAIVAEDTRIDSALAAWLPAGRAVVRMPPDGEAVAAALADGRTVLAGPTARRQLLLAGVEFTEAFAVEDPAPMVMSSVKRTFRCAAVRSDRWSLLPGVDYTGRLGIVVPPSLGGEMQVVVGDALPLAVRVETADGRFVPVEGEALLSGPGSAAPPADYWLESGRPEDSPHLATRLHLAAHPVRTSLLSLRLGRRAPRVVARLIGFPDSARGRVCAAPVSSRVLFDGAQTVEAVDLADHDLFGRGWYGVERVDAERQRWTDGDAVLLLRSGRRAAVTVELDAAPVTASAGERGPGALIPLVTLRVNGVDLGSRLLRAEVSRYRWDVPAGTWLAGTNEIWWHLSQVARPADAGGTDTRELGMRVTAVTVRLRPEASAPALQ